jgi:hypothetical protein
MKSPPVLIMALLLGIAVDSLAQTSSSQPKDLNHVPGVANAEFSADGKQLITTSPDKTARVWHATTSTQPSNRFPHLGTWQLESFKYGDHGKWTDAPQTLRRLKLITEKHFVWVEYEVSSGKVQSMAGGTFTYNEGAYTETIDYAGEGMTDYLGKKQSFTIKVEGGKLHQSGQLSDGLKIEEIWRIK